MSQSESEEVEGIYRRNGAERAIVANFSNVGGRKGTCASRSQQVTPAVTFLRGFGSSGMSSRAGDSSFYAEKVILAPMVRAGRTPLRLLALEYGADLAYTEEIVDQKLISCVRRVNDCLGTIDYAFEDEIVLRVCPAREGDKCVLQLGSSDAERLVEVAKFIGNDVGAFDLNMGCPKPFSIAGGMGAALLSQPDRVKTMLTSLVAVSPVPVSCKIRVLNKSEDTLEIAKMIERCGVAALGIHGRRIGERHGDANRVDEIREVARSLSIPVIANGGSSVIAEYDDIEKFRLDCGASSVMIARKALIHPSIFRQEGILSFEDDIRNLLRLACEFDEHYTTLKYAVQRILGSEQEFDSRGRQTVLGGSVLDICKAWSMEDTYNYFKLQQGRKRKVEADILTGIHFIDLSFPPKRLRDQRGSFTPKCALNDFCDEKGIRRPEYFCRYRPADKRYEALVEVNGQKFLSRVGQPNKKMAEQVAALAALVGMDKRERLPGDWEE